MQNFVKNNWAIMAFCIGLLINASAAYLAVQISITKMDSRVTAVEERQDRQGEAIMDVRDQVDDVENSILRLEVSVSHLDADLNYIRNKLDRVFP